MRRILLFILPGVAGLLCLAGCRDRDKTPQYHTVKGRVTSINLTSGEVAMRCYIPKRKQEEDVTGKLAPEAEIFINNSTARLEDVRTDDQVEVQGYLQKREDADPIWVATRVKITRGDAATQPSTSETQAAQ